MNVPRIFLALVFAGALLQACASAPPPGDQDRPLIAPGRALTLPSPATFGRKADVAQLITVHWRDQTFAFEAFITISPEQVVVAGIDGMGRRAMTITWRDTGMTQEAASWLPEGMRPGPVLADIVMLYWPEDVVRRALEPAGATLVAEGTRRLVRIGAAPVLEADYTYDSGAAWPRRVRYRNLSWGYSMEIESVELGG